jgi:hypothetical protein
MHTIEINKMNINFARGVGWDSREGDWEFQKKTPQGLSRLRKKAFDRRVAAMNFCRG